jgi:hypothetical protein
MTGQRFYPVFTIAKSLSAKTKPDSSAIFYVFSMCAATNAVASGASGSLPSQPLVLLRSSKLLQKKLITALYGGA